MVKGRQPDEKLGAQHLGGGVLIGMGTGRQGDEQTKALRATQEAGCGTFQGREGKWKGQRVNEDKHGHAWLLLF